VGWAALRGIWANLRAMRQTAPALLSFQELMALCWQAFEGKIMLILSERDLTAQEFIEYASNHAQWRPALQRPGVTRHNLAGADHTCSQPGQQDQLEQLTLHWLATLV
jgi:hypothetical protein